MATTGATLFDMDVLDVITDRVLSYRAGRRNYPVFSDGQGNQLINGDCLDRSVLDAESIDLTVTSPPYNVGIDYDGSDDTIPYDAYLRFSRKWLENCYHWTKPAGRLCVNVSLDKNKQGKAPLTADITRVAMDAGWKYHATIIWNEGNISRRTAWGSWLSASAPHIIAPVETIIVLYKDEWIRGNVGTSTIARDDFMEWVGGVWTFPGESRRKQIGHEAPFPRELPKRCIQLLSFREDTILDPFSGSGTTMIEAMSNGRQSIGIEISAHDCRLTRERILKECTVALTT